MRRISVAVLLLAFAEGALAFSFHLNQMEFNSWPEYCKAKYVVTNVGSASPYVSQVSDQTIAKWGQRLGRTWPNIHHGCASMIWIVRSEQLAGKDEQQYAYALKQAAGESQYSIQRTNPQDPIYTKLVTVHARVEYALGKRDQAVQTLQSAIRNAPEVADSYAVLATLLYKQGKFSEAREILQSGVRKAKPPTAEMHYFLGLVLVKENNYAEATKHAKQAYALGYPLPGLKNKLRASGHWGQ